jgi:hypothetical protein
MKWAGVWLVGALLSCGPVDVIIATLPDGGLAGPPCANDTDCGGGFCEKDLCNAASGHCVHHQFCVPTFAPECGCDGVTYLNSCERRSARSSRASANECQGLACSSTQPCPGPSTCNRTSTTVNTCSNASDVGTCWGVPPSCPGIATFQLCDVPNTCLDFCQAMHSSASSKPVASCP